MKLYSFDDTTIIGFVNAIKEQLIDRLEIDGLLDPDQKIAIRYAFVLSTRGILGKLIDSLWKVDDDKLRMLIVEINKPINPKDQP